MLRFEMKSFSLTKLLFSFVLIGLVISNVYSKDLVIDSKSLFRNVSTDRTLTTYPNVTFQIVPSVAREVFTADYDKVKIMNFPFVQSQVVDLVLEKADIPFDQNTEFYRGTKDGLIRTKAPILMCLSGKISGQENSFVFMNFTEFGLIGTIQTESGIVYTISPQKDSKEGNHILTVSNSQVLNENKIFSCYTEDYSGNSNELDDYIKYYKDDVPLASKPLLEVKLACEGTYDFFSIFGSSQPAIAYITAVIAQSSKIYQEFFNVRLYIGYVVVWEDSWEDPYTGTANLSEKLQKMPSIWKGKTIDRALTVLFANLASQPANETVAGISFGGTPYYGSLCNKDWGYCVLGIRGNATYPTLNYTWDVNVATHEMGHNFSLPHTHNCYWQPNMIDTCVTGQTYGVGDACIKTGNPIPRPGTIMSYCHLTNSTHSVQLIFHPRELPLARSAAERSSCVKQASSPYISLLNPLGDKTYIAGEVLPIRWTSAKVNYLTIFFSSDNGANWSLLADNVPATDSIYYWQLPNIKTTRGLIYIRDKGNPNVADTSMRPFSIMPKTITVQSPKENDEFAQGETVALSWEATLVDTFTVQFSTDGGKNFTTLAEDYLNKYYEMTAPQIQSDECKFRVKSKDGKIVSESPIFKIGVPNGKIIYPKGGEVMCVGAGYTVKWESSYINKIQLEYSTDEGANWRKLALGNIDAKLGAFVWKIPNKISNRCLVRIKPTFSETTLARSDSVFSIDSCQAVGEVPFEDLATNGYIFNVKFNPVDNEITFEVDNSLLPKNPRISIYDLLGRQIFADYLSNIPFSNNLRVIKLNNAYQGILFLILQFDEGRYVGTTILIR